MGAYDELLTGISSKIKTADILEEIRVRDIVDLVNRLRGCPA